MTDNMNTVENINESQSVGETQDVFAGENKQNGKGEKSFTQSQLQNLISERLKRERKNNESLMEVKTLLTDLSSAGILESKSYSEMAKELCKRLNSDSQKEENKESDSEENSVGNTLPLNDAEISENENHKDFSAEDNADAKETVNETPLEQQTQKDEYLLEEILTFKQNFPDTDINSLFENKAFLAFSKGKNNSLCNLYGDYVLFMSTLYGDGKTAERKQESDSFSTSFSAHNKSYGNDYSGILSKRQMEIAKSEGMSYREYAQLLSSIPSKKNVNF